MEGSNSTELNIQKTILDLTADKIRLEEEAEDSRQELIRRRQIIEDLRLEISALKTKLHEYNEHVEYKIELNKTL